MIHSVMQAIELARRVLLSDRIDVAVALDPVVVEVDREDIGATLMNRLVVRRGLDATHYCMYVSRRPPPHAMRCEVLVDTVILSLHDYLP